MSKKKYLCPCCKKYVFEEGPGSYEICPVCSWEDDKIQAEDGDDVYYVESTNEFVIVSTDGYIRTYFNPDAGITYYNRQ